MQKTVTYIQGSCSFSQMQNIFPHLQGKNKKKRGWEEEKRGGGRHKGSSYFLCHLLASTFTAFPLHHVKDCKQANNNSASETTVRERHIVSWRSLNLQLRRKKTFVFTVHLNFFIFFCTEKKVAWGFMWTIVSGLAKYLWHMSFTGCRGAITVIYDQTSHHGISFSKWYTAIHQWIPPCVIFLSNRGHVTGEHAGGLLLITDTQFDEWIHVKQSNLL